jgi:hypothetical protein
MGFRIDARFRKAAAQLYANWIAGVNDLAHFALQTPQTPQ